MDIEKTAPSDVVVVILSLVGEGKTFPLNRNFLYEKFYELSESFPALFEDQGYVFDTSKIYPYCEMVNIAVNRIIGGWKMVEWKDSEHDCVILPLLVKKGKESMALFSAADRIQLSNAAEKFKEMINAPYEEKKECKCKVCTC